MPRKELRRRFKCILTFFTAVVGDKAILAPFEVLPTRANLAFSGTKDMIWVFSQCGSSALGGGHDSSLVREPCIRFGEQTR